MHAWSRHVAPKHVRLASMVWAPRKSRDQHRPSGEVIGPFCATIYPTPAPLESSSHRGTALAPPRAHCRRYRQHFWLKGGRSSTFSFDPNALKRSDALPASGCRAAGRSVGAAGAPTGGQQPVCSPNAEITAIASRHAAGRMECTPVRRRPPPGAPHVSPPVRQPACAAGAPAAAG